MSARELRDALLALDAERKRTQAEIEADLYALSHPPPLLPAAAPASSHYGGSGAGAGAGGSGRDAGASTVSTPPVGMTGSLVDADGFPRADVDVLWVRTTRQRVLCRRNDLKAMDERAALLLQQLHALGPDALAAVMASMPPAPAPAPAPVPVAPPASTSAADAASSPAPFVLVDEVTPASPAAEAGLRVGDRIYGLGRLRGASTASARSPTLPDVAALVRESIGTPLQVQLLRPSEGAATPSAPQHVSLMLTPRPWTGAGVLGCHLTAIQRA